MNTLAPTGRNGVGPFLSPLCCLQVAVVQIMWLLRLLPSVTCSMTTVAGVRWSICSSELQTGCQLLHLQLTASICFLCVCVRARALFCVVSVKPPLQTLMDVANLMESLAGVFEGVVQYNKDNNDFEVSEHLPIH